MNGNHFKIVSFDDDDVLRSCSVKDPAWLVEYKLNVPVTPIRHATKLFVFKDLQLTREWAKSAKSKRSNWAIYECEVENPESTMLRSRFTSSRALSNFWDKNWDDNIVAAWDKVTFEELDLLMEFDLEVVPNGTVLVDSVTLIRFVEIVPDWDEK
jgi:hypothetical protein